MSILNWVDSTCLSVLYILQYLTKVSIALDFVTTGLHITGFVLFLKEQPVYAVILIIMYQNVKSSVLSNQNK